MAKALKSPKGQCSIRNFLVPTPKKQNFPLPNKLTMEVSVKVEPLKMRQENNEKAKEKLMEKEIHTILELVWAKYYNYPPWPAIIWYFFRN